MIFVWCRGKLDVSIPAGKSFNARRFTRSGGGGALLLVFFAFRQTTVGFHSQHAVDQRTAGKELTVIGIATVAMFLNSGVNRDAAVPFLTNFLVIMLTTPPSASEPYSEDMGPRTTSMRSIASTGIQFRSKSLWRKTALRELTRLPSIRSAYNCCPDHEYSRLYGYPLR